MHRPLLSQWQCPKKLTSQQQRLIAAQKSQSQMSAIETAILEDEDVRCHNFSVGNPRLQEFYSPGYPGKYPPKSDCILALKGSHAFCLLQDTCSTLVLFFFYCKICLSCFYFRIGLTNSRGGSHHSRWFPWPVRHWAAWRLRLRFSGSARRSARLFALHEPILRAQLPAGHHVVRPLPLAAFQHRRHGRIFRIPGCLPVHTWHR